MTNRIGEFDVGDLVMWSNLSMRVKQQSGIVIEVKMVRQHSYLDQEQVATVLWEDGRTREVNSMSLRSIEDYPCNV